MGRFVNTATGVTFSVDDSKDHRYTAGGFENPGKATAEGYGSQKVAELKAEIARRNEGRDEADHLDGSGNKADLVALLEADDEK